MSGVKCLIGACIAVLASAAAGAQDTRNPQPGETLVVTATRIEQSVYDIPAAIDAVSGDALRAHRPNVDLSEGIGRIPGIVVQNRYNYAQDLQVSSRGFGARAAFGVRGVRLLQDDIPLTMPDGQGQTALFDLDGADRIEVLRGPFAALYGNSSGGVIHLLSALDAKTSQFKASGTNDENGTWRGALNFSGAAGPTDFSGNLARFDTDGFRDHSAAQRDTANLWLRYRPDEASRRGLGPSNSIPAKASNTCRAGSTTRGSFPGRIAFACSAMSGTARSSSSLPTRATRSQVLGAS
jgi:iron complex outermembrane receptor protein